MSGAQVSVRQRMINVMYLVLTAMLALNVSAEILKSFFLMEKNMDKTGQNIDTKNGEMLLAFEKQMQTQPDLTREYYAKAKEAKRISEDFNQYVENLKKYLVNETGGRMLDDNGKEGELKGRDNMEMHAYTLIKEKKGEELRLRINETREKLLALLPGKESKQIISDLVANNEYGEQTWESFHFEHAPLAAVIANMSKIQNDAKNTTYDVLYKLYQKIGGSTIPINSVQAAIVPKSNYVMNGDQFEAEVFLSAFSTRQANEVVINGQTYTAENGKVVYKVPAGVTGDHTIKGEIRVREADSLRSYPFTTTYTVYKGAASISADNMKMLYTGVDNPLTITVPGITPERVRATISSGSLTKTGPSTYTANVATTGTITVRVEVKDDYGNWRMNGEETFKSRNPPPPEIRFGALEDGKTYPVGSPRAQNSLLATSGPIYFRGLEYKVTGFELVIVTPRNTLGPMRSSSSALTTEMKNAINSIPPGSRLIFTGIKVDRTPAKQYSFTILTR